MPEVPSVSVQEVPVVRVRGDAGVERVVALRDGRAAVIVPPRCEPSQPVPSCSTALAAVIVVLASNEIVASPASRLVTRAMEPSARS